MRKIFLALMAVAAITLTGCENPKNEGDPNPPENKGANDITCTCGNRYAFTQIGERTAATSGANSQSDYKVYASGFGGSGNLYLDLEKYPFVIYSVGNISVGYYFWRCECGRYHKVMTYDGTHTEIPSGEQPEEWNQYNYLWE